MTEISKFDLDLVEAIPKLARASVLVVGDAMLDRYVFGTVSRISPEAPVPVLAVEYEQDLPGGAGNVVRNLTALGVAVAFVSVVGDDQAGSDLTGLIGGQPNIEPWLLVQGGRSTTVKTRFIARGQQLLRSDHEVTGPVHPKLAERMLRITGDALAATSVTVLSDYGKGVLAGDMPGRVIEAARAAGRPVVVDPKGQDYDRYANADVVIPTVEQLEAVTGMSVSSPTKIALAARWLRTAHGFGAVVVNRGLAGISVISADLEAHLPSQVAESFDFSGSQDTCVSAIAAGLAAGFDLGLAARLANLAVGVSALQPGVSVALAADLLAMLTPEGRVQRKFVSAEVAVDQAGHWRRQGFRVGLVLAPRVAILPAGIEPAALESARAGCDRLVVATLTMQASEVTLDMQRLLADAAKSGSVDLVCALAEGSEADFVQGLRPDLITDLTDSG